MDTPEHSLKSTEQEIPEVHPYRLRDREQLRKRKLESQEKKTSLWMIKEESKRKRGRKTKAEGTSRKHTKEPVVEPEPSPKPVIVEEYQEETKVDHPDPESETSPPLEESPKLLLTEETPATSTDVPGETGPAGVEIPEFLQFQSEHVPEENATFEEPIVLGL
ncbi:hemogen [Mustelus asterias]